MAEALVRIKILKQTTAAKAVARKDDVIDVSPSEAIFLCGQGQAELAPKASLKKNDKEKPAKKEKPAPTAIPSAPAGAESK
ncbi:MAG: hypothetical protein ACXWQE_00105 [Bdellovibrionales bacterium]